MRLDDVKKLLIEAAENCEFSKYDVMTNNGYHLICEDDFRLQLKKCKSYDADEGEQDDLHHFGFGKYLDLNFLKEENRGLSEYDKLLLKVCKIKDFAETYTKSAYDCVWRVSYDNNPVCERGFIRVFNPSSLDAYVPNIVDDESLAIAKILNKGSTALNYILEYSENHKNKYKIY